MCVVRIRVNCVCVCEICKKKTHKCHCVTTAQFIEGDGDSEEDAVRDDVDFEETGVRGEETGSGGKQILQALKQSRQWCRA